MTPRWPYINDEPDLTEVTMDNVSLSWTVTPTQPDMMSEFSTLPYITRTHPQAEEEVHTPHVRHHWGAVKS